MNNTAILMEIESARTLTDPSERYAAFEDIAFRNEAAPVEYALAVTELGMLHVSRGEYLIASAYFQEAIEKDPTNTRGLEVLAHALLFEKSVDKKAEILLGLLKNTNDHSVVPLPFDPPLVYDELADICVGTGRTDFLRKAFLSCGKLQTQIRTPLTSLEDRMYEVESANVFSGFPEEISDAVMIEGESVESTKQRILARIPYWTRRREWIHAEYKQMYLHGIVIAGEVFDYLASLDSSKGAEQKKAVAYAEATVEYAALRRSSSISETITNILIPAWGVETYNERIRAIYALCSLNNHRKWPVTTPSSDVEISSITTVALAHLGHHTDTFPQTMYERIQYCGRALIDIEQQKDVPPFWKHIYGQVLTGYVEKLIKNDGLVKV